MTPALWPHQDAELAVLRDKTARYIPWKMRVGKSALAIAAARQWEARSILILCPKSVISVWQEQFSSWWPECRVLAPTNGTVAKRSQHVAAWQGAVVLNYEAAWRKPMAQALLAHQWDVVVADEVHRIASPRGVASRFVATIPARRKLGLSGTPMPNGPLGIWSQMRFLAPGVLHRWYTPFRQTHTRPCTWREQPDGVTAGPGGALQPYRYTNIGQLEARLAPWMAPALKVEDVIADLPPVIDEARYCDLEPAARRTYKALEHDLIAEVAAGATLTASNALTRLLRLQQITSGHVPIDSCGDIIRISTAKLDLLVDLLADLPDDEPVVVFARFHADIDAVKAALSGRVLELSGRINQLAEWQRGDAPILVVQPQAGGLGVSMARAAVVIMYSLSFSLAEWEQARARVMGSEQTRPVMVISLLARDTVDEHIASALHHKQDVVSSVMEGIRERGRR